MSSFFIQNQCCGIKGADDWTDRGIVLPISCCNYMPASVRKCTKEYASDGCRDKLYNEFEKGFILILAIDLFAILFHVS